MIKFVRSFRPPVPVSKLKCNNLTGELISVESDLSINPPGFSIQLCNGDRGASQRVNKILKRRYGITGELISGNSTPGVVALWPKRTHPEEEEEEEEAGHSN